MRKIIEVSSFDEGRFRPSVFYKFTKAMDIEWIGRLDATFHKVKLHGLPLEGRSVIDGIFTLRVTASSYIWCHKCVVPDEVEICTTEVADPLPPEADEFERFRSWAEQLGLVPGHKREDVDDDPDYEPDVDDLPIDSDLPLEFEDEEFGASEDPEEIPSETAPVAPDGAETEPEPDQDQEGETPSEANLS